MLSVDSFLTRYSNTLDMFVMKPIRVTRTSRTLINNINTNLPMRISATDVIATSIVSDHDSPFACINVGVDRYLNIVYSSDNPEEQLEHLNSMFKECIERHAPLRRERVTSFG